MKDRLLEKDVVDTERKFRVDVLYEKTNDIIYSHDLEWKILSLNPAVERILGYTAGDLLGKDILEAVHPDSASRLRQRLETRLCHPDRKMGPMELLIYAKDGREKWLEVNATLLTTPEGLPHAVQGIARDITDRKQAERKLLISEQTYRAIFENTNAAMSILGEDNVLTLVNGEFEKMTGYSREEVEGKRTWMSFVEPGDMDRLMGYHAARMQSREAPRNYEFRLVSKDGGIKHIYITVALIGGTRQFVLSMTDLTELKRVQSSLQESEARYRTFLDASSDGAFMKDEDFRYILANRAFLEKFGLGEEREILGKRDDEVLPPDIARLAGRSDRRALEAGSLVVVEEHVRNQILETRKFPVVLRNGKTGIGALIRDITEIRRSEEEKKRLEVALERAGKLEALGMLTGSVAHDLNNVLGGIVSLPELLMMKLEDGNPMKKQLDIIRRSGEKAARIVQDMLTLTRRSLANATVVSLNDIVTMHFETPEHDKLQFYHPDVRFEMRLDEQLPNIVGSPLHLSKTVMNLLSNAAEAMPQGGMVTIATEYRYIDQPIRGYDDIREGDYVVVTVTDTGVGIPREDIERIFEPFYTKKVMGRSGTGLGMTVVWGTVKDHKGYIDVRSEVDKGTTFSLYFPATRKKVKKEKDRVPMERYMGNGQTLLVVDDVPDQLELASSMLSRVGYRVVTASSGENALEYLKDHFVDLVVLDMIMEPGIDGLETYKRILELHPGQKAIITSGYVEKTRIQEAQKLGVGTFIKKPYVLEEIGMAIRNELNVPSNPESK
ncbi:MAG TPA: PAS domain S-box protein [Syntrophales bacterium]|nr:PAS domain S-box protein [Syntrophales bacterium]HQB29946.1 PAS domain S-box protein [Syntrophales bacterium]HQQ26024.1 PAS domain S-box protein [Syntrophales bacterium]